MMKAPEVCADLLETEIQRLEEKHIESEGQVWMQSMKNKTSHYVGIPVINVSEDERESQKTKNQNQLLAKTISLSHNAIDVTLRFHDMYPQKQRGRWLQIFLHTKNEGVILETDKVTITYYCIDSYNNKIKPLQRR
eukprot:Pgem_evm1s2500